MRQVDFPSQFALIYSVNFEKSYSPLHVLSNEGAVLRQKLNCSSLAEMRPIDGLILVELKTPVLQVRLTSLAVTGNYLQSPYAPPIKY